LLKNVCSGFCSQFVSPTLALSESRYTERQAGRESGPPRRRLQREVRPIVERDPLADSDIDKPPAA